MSLIYDFLFGKEVLSKDFFEKYHIYIKNNIQKINIKNILLIKKNNDWFIKHRTSYNEKIVFISRKALKKIQKIQKFNSNSYLVNITIRIALGKIYILDLEEFKNYAMSFNKNPENDPIKNE